MKTTGIKIMEEELKRVQIAFNCSGMYLSGGKPMSNVEEIVADLAKKYNAPEGSGLDVSTGEFVMP